MKISYRNIPKFQNGTTGGGIGTVSWTNPNSTWFTRSGNNGILEGTYNYLKRLHDKWQTTKSYQDYKTFKEAVDELNNYQRTGYAPNHLRYLNNNNTLFTDSKVGDWQNIIKSKYSFVNDAIGKNFSLYNIHSNNPYSGDNPTKSWNVDNHWAGITDDRTTWGYYNNESDPDYLKWKEKFSEIGIEYKTNPNWNTDNVLYGFLKDDNPAELKTQLSLPIDARIPEEKLNSLLLVFTGHKEGGYGFDWSKINTGLLKLLGNPNLYAFGRLAENLINNERVYNEALKGIKPSLRQTYQTHRLVVGDEATKLGYYTRAAEGVTKASRPITSDLDKLLAYQIEAQRLANDLRAQGDLADNQEIRRTSDESNQHQWANTLRATEVANANIAELNQANSLKHNLLALKHSALWSSLDNYLQGIEYRKRLQLAEQLQLEDLIWSLLHQGFLYSPEYLLAYTEYLKVRELHKNENNIYDDTHPDVVAARIKFLDFIKQAKIKELLDLAAYRRNRYTINIGKSGTKLTYKKKDDLLYKSAKDKMEHFRKISKITSDSHNRKQIKIEKLTSHPKGVKKYAQGGIGPFTVYTPVALGGETSSTVSYDSSAKATKQEKDETLELIKSLFKEVEGKGLKIDVETIYTSMSNLLQLAQLFGSELSTSDIQAMYLLAMYLLNSVLRSKDIFDKAKAYATLNDALNEFAVTSDGRYVVQDKTGKISATTNDWEEAKKLGNPITNALLLNLREYSSLLLLYNGDKIIDEVINSGMGLNKIASQIKAMAGNIGSSTEKIEGLTEVLSLKVKAGLQLLAQTDGTPDGIYKVTNTNKNSLNQVNAALEFIVGMLSPSLKAILNAHGGTGPLVAKFLTSQTNNTIEQTLSPLTGRASNSNKNKNESDGGIKSNFLDLLLRDLIGITREFSIVTKDGPSKLYSLNSKYISLLPNVVEDMNLNEMLDKSKIGSIMDSRLGVTFGDQIIDPTNFKDIMFDLGGGATVVTLPCKYENGHKVVNFAIKDEFDDAIKEVSKTVPINYLDQTFIKALSEKLHEKGLDSLLNGDSIDPNMLGHFLVVSAYTTDKININTDSRYIEKVKNPDKSLEERLIKGLSTNKDKNDYELDIDDKWGLFELTYDDVYRGSVFIPLSNDPVSAQTGWGNDNIKLDETRSLAEQYQDYQKSLKQKDSSSRNLYERE